jgi:hypothetical protein
MKALPLYINLVFALTLILMSCSGNSNETQEQQENEDTPPVAIARFNVVPYQDIDSSFNVGVVAFHKDGIERVDFVFTDGVDTITDSKTSMTLNTRTEVEEYWTEFDPAQFDDGEITITATAIPNSDPSYKRDITISLFANANGTYNDFETYYVKPSTGSDDDDNSGTLASPFATISRAFYALGRTANRGRIVLVEEGTYEFGELEKSDVSRNNEGWIIIEGDPSLDRDNIIIANPTLINLKPQIDKIKFRHMSFDFLFLGQFYGNFKSENSAYWFDDCKWYLSSGWATDLDIDENKGISRSPVRGNYYVTDSLAYDTIFAFIGAKIVRGSRLEQISGDCLQNSEFIVNTTLNNIDGTIQGHHTDVYQMWGAQDNVIMYKVSADNLNSTQAFFLEPTFQSPLGYPQYKMTNSAFVDCEIINDTITNRNGTIANWGGPPWSQMVSQFNHILFKNLSLPYQRFYLRNDNTNNQAWHAENVIFENVELHWATYDQLCNAYSDAYTGPPEGVTITNCSTTN